MSNSDVQSIVLVGVGGQGILLSSEIAASAAMHAGYDVKTNEVHGMAQRGGSVIAQIRYGKKVYSPLVSVGTARVLVSLEKMEVLRYSNLLADDGLAVVSTQTITPVTVSMGAAKYPDSIDEKISSSFKRLIMLDAAKLASQAGNIKAANVALLGAMSNNLDLPVEAWHKAIRGCVKPQFVDLNLSVFDAGRAMKG
ncbi:MAG: indolepyruvate oxidoreductase subunit beta [Sedimentisphaerales bacterium]|nr:indolepyruvate oxidoreductase subunit beta [Sedimentisphaerales bacterium]MBN2842676.1 indolepyruvate oxidoreductase subunit beta [Sedimentisphaerales bacterium]